MAAIPDLNSDAGLKKLDDYLLTRSYLTGYQASKADLTIFVSLSNPPSSEYVNTCRWYKHIVSLLRFSDLSSKGSGVTVEEGSAPITEEAVATHPAAASKDTSDDVDLFEEETEEEKKAAEDRSASVKASTKKKESGKSSVLIDIKPWGDETHMKKLEEAVRMDGFFLAESKLVPVGYGINKLHVHHC